MNLEKDHYPNIILVVIDAITQETLVVVKKENRLDRYAGRK